jgi:hypothetical protein
VSRGEGPGALGVEARVDPITVARGLHARFEIQKPSDIEIELIAWRCGATVLWRETGSADARVTLSGGRAYLAIAEHARGTTRARYSVAHELSHLLMHRDFDAIARIHGGARTARREFRVELEADRCASELLLPTALAAPVCVAVAQPTLDDVGALAATFRVSLTVADLRWPTMTRAGCAFFEAKAGIIKRVVRSEGFRGVAVGRRELEPQTLALEMLRAGSAASAYARRVHDAAWESGALGGPIVEECVPAADGVVLGWLRHG